MSNLGRNLRWKSVRLINREINHSMSLRLIKGTIDARLLARSSGAIVRGSAGLLGEILSLKGNRSQEQMWVEP